MDLISTSLIADDLIKNTVELETDKKPLGDRMKDYEAEMDILRILPYELFIIRLDGKNFSKFTKGFKKPFDLLFIRAMGLTTMDLVKKFDAQTGYSHSDEITLIFNQRCTKEKYEELCEIGDKNIIPIHLFDGRVQKNITLISSYCSVRFNYHLANLMNETDLIYDEKFIEIINSHEQIFDARIIKFSQENIHEILNHQIWRSVHDCCRNAISTYAYTHFGSKKIMNKNSSQMIEMLSSIDILWDDVPIFIKHGL